MLQGFFWVQSVERFFNQELGYKILSFLWHVFSGCLLKRKLASSDFFGDFLLVGSIERWRPTEDDEGDHSDGPDVTLFVVFVIEDFWSDVVWLGGVIFRMRGNGTVPTRRFILFFESNLLDVPQSITFIERSSSFSESIMFSGFRSLEKWRKTSLTEILPVDNFTLVTVIEGH